MIRLAKMYEDGLITYDEMVAGMAMERKQSKLDYLLRLNLRASELLEAGNTKAYNKVIGYIENVVKGLN